MARRTKARFPQGERLIEGGDARRTARPDPIPPRDPAGVERRLAAGPRRTIERCPRSSAAGSDAVASPEPAHQARHRDRDGGRRRCSWAASSGRSLLVVGGGRSCPRPCGRRARSTAAHSRFSWRCRSRSVRCSSTSSSSPAPANVLFRIGPITATVGGRSRSPSRSWCRILAIAGAITLFYLTTRPADLVVDLERRGVSPRVAFVANASVQTVPAMLERASQITAAQRARGLDTEGSLLAPGRAGIVPIVGPVILGAIGEVEERTMALEARGFTRPGRRTLLWCAGRLGRQRLTRWVVALAVPALLAARIAGWLDWSAADAHPRGGQLSVRRRAGRVAARCLAGAARRGGGRHRRRRPRRARRRWPGRLRPRAARDRRPAARDGAARRRGPGGAGDA